MKTGLLSGRRAFVPAGLFLVLAYARPEHRLVWALIALVFFVIAMRKKKKPAAETVV